MNEAAHSKAEDEIARLVGLGFLDWQKDLNGVRVRRSNHKKNIGSISFPHSAYSGNSLTRDDFWSRHRGQVILDALKSMDQELIWEVGGGDGRVGLQLAEKGIGVVFIEPLYEGCSKVAKVGLPVYLGTLQDLHLPDNSLSAVGFFDVLEHIEDERAFLKYLQAKLERRGLIFLTVPAHQWLFSRHDEALGHFRRYNKKSISRIITESGYQVISCRYMFGILVLPALINRRLPYLLGRQYEQEEVIQQSEKYLKLPNCINRTLKFVLAFEKFGLRFIGTSLFLVARKV